MPKAPAGNSSYEVENNVAKASEAEISKGMPEDGGSSAGTQTKSFILVKTCHLFKSSFMRVNSKKWKKQKIN